MSNSGKTYRNNEALIHAMNSVKVMVIGDVMLDSYFWGKVERISPEAPVPVVSVEKKESRLGGAANVALNIKAMEAEAILCAVIGNDTYGDDFLRLMDENELNSDGILRVSDRPTTIKTRVIGNNHQLLRIDQESDEEIQRADADKFFDLVCDIANKNSPDVLIFEDYDKGLLNEELITKIIDFFNSLNIPICVDPKKKNFFSYKNTSLFKPNLKELREGLNLALPVDDTAALIQAAQLIIKRQGHKYIMVTLSEKGVLIADAEQAQIFPAHIRKIADVSGAGDTVISIAALALALGAEKNIIAQISNLAGGLVCESVGVVPIDKQRIIEESASLDLV